MTDEVRLLETMRADASGIALWSRHRTRLVASAAAFDVALDLDRIERTLADRLDGTAQRVRLTVGMAGDVHVHATALAPTPFHVAWLDPEPFDGFGSRYCIHKTTRREAYERRRSRAIARGADEALLLGTDGRLVEGTRTSVWVEREGRFLTPPRSAGGLPGVMRAHLLATRDDTAEARLPPADLVLADGVWLSNAVVGLVRVTVLPVE